MTTRKVPQILNNEIPEDRERDQEELARTRILELIKFRKIGLSLRQSGPMFRSLLGTDVLSTTSPAGRAGRGGVVASGVFLLIVAGLMILLSDLSLVPSIVLSAFGIFILVSALKSNLTRSRANIIALIGHLCALFSFYLFFTRMVNVTYVTDSIVGTYMGIVKIMQFQNPYSYSIKSFLDQLGFPPSFYTPRVDGTFEFHLNYPAMNFLALMPTYLAGLHDLRDGVFVFHLASVLAVFSLVPSRLKALSLAPFAVGFPLAIGYSWTDSVWAFFILLTVVFWRRNRGVSMLSFGLSVATKQIAIVAAPFLLIRVWKESEGYGPRSVAKGLILILAGFMVPNLPFIVTSPSEWWAGIVGPYLPSSAPLVPGGIGLSEILPDVGLVLSPAYFSVLTVLASVACLALFIANYRRLNRFLWAMPVIVLFFYPRSYPNYIVYWGFPYILEWFRDGNPSLNLFRTHSLVSLTRKTPAWNLHGLLRRRVGPMILVLLSLTSVLAGVSGAYVSQASRPRLDVRVVGMEDRDALGIATTLIVNVTSYNSPVSPKFFVKWFFLWDLWTANTTGTVPSSTTQTFQLTATDALAGVPRGRSFRVAVYDSLSWEFLGESVPSVSTVPRTAVANPRFTWWTLDTGTGQVAPLPWKLSSSARAGEAGILPGDSNASSGVRFWINSTSDKGLPKTLRLSQRILFNETDLDARVFLDSSVSSLGSASFGFQATDGVHMLVYVVSSVAPVRIVTTFASNTTVTLPVKEMAWQAVPIDIQSTWLSQGWAHSPGLVVSLFLRSNSEGYCTAQIEQVDFGN